MQAAEELPVIADERVRRALTRVGDLVRERWHLDTLLGVGGTASVYAATHRNGKRVALKMLHPELSASPEMRQRFVDEGYLANSVDHPGAVSVIDDDVTEDGHVFLIMDLLEGETLDQTVGDGGWLLPTRVLAIADDVLDILAAAHDKGIVHRDVKPDNIFITREGEVKLLDFGIARVAVPGRTRTTQMGTPLGTPAFMPPEQARGRLEELDGRTDLWALGATMFFLLTGRDVHEAETVAEELLAAMTKPAPSLGQLAPHLPQALVELVDRALAFERTDRWPNAREMQAAVRRVRDLSGSDSIPLVSRRYAALPAAPTLVTPSLIPAVLQKSPPRSRFLRPVAIVAVSAAASFAALVAVRQIGRNLRPNAAHAAPTLAHEARWESPSGLDEVRTPGDDRTAPETLAAPASSISTPPESPASPPKAPAGRPKVLPRPVEEARTWVASGARPSSTSLSPERLRASPPVDPLDRRK